jgi:hypothetical protein
MRALAVALLALAAPAHAGEPQCRIVDLSLAPAAAAGDPGALPQIVAWIEDASGTFVDTVYITHATGTFGIGNRPGRFDFNSGFRWPYGRRITTFPVWSNKHGLVWPELIFQDSVVLGQTESDNRLSHDMDESSIDPYFCRPQFGADATSCPSAINKVDKGMFGTAQSKYPPRNDLTVASQDSADVAMFGVLNPFDAISQPTPPFGVDAAASYAVPFELPAGDYVLWVEVAKEVDMNGSYNPTFYPSPDVSFGNYGEAYRGQPSVLYRVPFSLVGDSSVATTSDYAGYGDPDGVDGTLRPPDATISTDTRTTRPIACASRRGARTTGSRRRSRARSTSATSPARRRRSSSSRPGTTARSARSRATRSATGSASRSPRTTSRARPTSSSMPTSSDRASCSRS